MSEGTATVSRIPQSFRPKQTYSQRFVRDVLARPGARFGLAWIVVVVFFAVFGPFIANSHPIIMWDAEGNWSMPMFRWLHPVDVLLVLAFFATLILTIGWRRRYSFGQNIAAAGWIVAAAIPPLFHAIVRAEWNQDQYSAVGRGFILCALILVTPVWLTLIVWPMVRMSWSKAFKTGLGVVALALWVTFILMPISPPAVFTEKPYRQQIREDGVTAIFTLIPFGPKDQMADLPQARALPPGWYPKDPDSPNLSKKEKDKIALARERGEPLPPRYQLLEGESYYNRLHLMGTTVANQDMASRMIHACRIALAIGFIATGIAVAIGVVVGGLLGYFSGWVDLLGSRVVEVFASIPTIFLLIAIVAFYGRNIYLMMAIIGMTSWVGYANFVRAEFLRLRKQDFVQAAIACGLPLRSILFRHMLPNGVAPVLVNASFGVAVAILTEATLSFLNLGLVDEPSWGQLLNQAREGGEFYWWIASFPGMAIFLTVFAYNLIGEAMRDSFDPHLKKASQI